MTHETERAQYAEDEARLGPEAWRWWQYRWLIDQGPYEWRDCIFKPGFYDTIEYRRNPATYPADRPVDADKTREES